MIHDILFYVCLPIVILIAIIGIAFFLIVALPEIRLRKGIDASFPDYNDDDYGDGDDDDYPDSVMINYNTRSYKALDEVHLIAEHLWGEATEYTVEHVRKLLELENSVYDFMIQQDAEVADYLEQMKIPA